MGRKSRQQLDLRSRTGFLGLFEVTVYVPGGDSVLTAERRNGLPARKPSRIYQLTKFNSHRPWVRPLRGRTICYLTYIYDDREFPTRLAKRPKRLRYMAFNQLLVTLRQLTADHDFDVAQSQLKVFQRGSQPVRRLIEDHRVTGRRQLIEP